MAITRAPFGKLADGTPIEQFTITNRSGASLAFIGLGGIVTKINVPDRDGRIGNVNLGFKTLADYETRNAPHFGALTGRFANRIAGAKFSIDGKEHRLAANEGPNTLHGGPVGFVKAAWRVEPAGDDAARLTLVSPDGDQGFPGTLTVAVTYRWTEDNVFGIQYEATTDKTTVVNLTNHAYFNLAGDGSGSIEAHVLTINADAITAGDLDGIPDGKLLPVAGTPFDFRAGMPIGARIRSAFEPLAMRFGYDHNYVLNRSGPGLSFCARAYDPVTGRIMTVETTEPAVQLYTGNFLNASIVGSGGRQYRQGDGFCLETQHYPDSPNQPSFPSTMLTPGQTFRSETTHRFGTDSG